MLITSFSLFLLLALHGYIHAALLFFFFLFFFCQMFTQLIHMLWWLGSNVCVYVAVISVAVTFFDDYSCLSLLIYLKNALALASGNYTAYLYVMMVRF
jgi:hypothetical protein